MASQPIVCASGFLPSSSQLLSCAASSTVTVYCVGQHPTPSQDFSEWSQCAVLELVGRYKPGSETEVYDLLNALEDRLGVANSGVALAATKAFLHLTLELPATHQQVSQLGLRHACERDTWVTGHYDSDVRQGNSPHHNMTLPAYPFPSLHTLPGFGAHQGAAEEHYRSRRPSCDVCSAWQLAAAGSACARHSGGRLPHLLLPDARSLVRQAPCSDLLDMARFIHG